MTPPNWHGENELITEVEADFGEVVLLDGVKSLKSITRYSNELARSSVVALDAALRDRMVRDVASKMDAAFIAGTGDVVDGKRTTPLGLLNYPGVQEVTGVGAPNLDALLDAIGLLIAANVDPTRCRLFMASRDWIAVRKLKDGGRQVRPPAGPDRRRRLPPVRDPGHGDQPHPDRHRHRQAVDHGARRLLADRGRPRHGPVGEDPLPSATPTSTSRRSALSRATTPLRSTLRPSCCCAASRARDPAGRPGARSRSSGRPARPLRMSRR